MRLEDYFDVSTLKTKFGPVECIRIKGHRIGIEHVVEAYREGMTPETIVNEYYPTLSLEKVYATITYYLHNRKAVDEYMRRGEAIADAFYQEHVKKGPDRIGKRLRKLMAQRRAGSAKSNA